MRLIQLEDEFLFPIGQGCFVVGVPGVALDRLLIEAAQKGFDLTICHAQFMGASTDDPLVGGYKKLAG